MPVELLVAERGALAVFAPEHQRRVLVPVTQEVLGEVEAAPGEPSRAGHLVAVLEHLLPGLARLHAAEGPDLGPELLRMGDGPLVEGFLARHVGIALAA